tara:strand:+ start:874 stop:1203 length:330 start_codon:yes stop_codon:yes gene_type:complete
MFIEIFKVSENKTFRIVWTFEIETSKGWRKGIIKLHKYEEQKEGGNRRYKTTGVWISDKFGERRKKEEVLKTDMSWIEKQEVQDVSNKEIYKALINEFDIIGWRKKGEE